MWPKSLILLAGELGFEPRQTESESVVLPLHYSPMDYQTNSILYGIVPQSLASRSANRRSRRGAVLPARCRTWQADLAGGFGERAVKRAQGRKQRAARHPLAQRASLHVQDLIVCSRGKADGVSQGRSRPVSDKLSSLRRRRRRFPNLPMLTCHAMLKGQKKGAARPRASRLQKPGQKPGIGWGRFGETVA
jgi:hypothetical protein